MKKEKTYQSLTFNTVRRRHEHLELTNSRTLSNEKYEEYEKSEPYDYISLYFHHKITGEPAVINDEIFTNEIQHNLNITEKHKDIWIDNSALSNAYRIANAMIAEVKELIPSCTVNITPIKDLFIKNDAGMYTFRKWKEGLDKLKSLLVEHDLHIIIGKPGVGKTHYTIDKLGYGKHLVVTLSNLVGANFVSRFNRSNRIDTATCEFMSYTKARFTPMRNYDTVIFEEASMLSTNELPLMIKCINHCKNVFFCGDTNQLPSFLGFGNILYGLLVEFPDKVVELKENHRCSTEVVNGMESIMHGSFPKVDSKEDFTATLTDALDNEHDFIIPAFMNSTVRKMNQMCLEHLADAENNSIENCIDKILLKNKKIPLRSTSNQKVKNADGTYSYMFYNNELCTLTKEGQYYVVKSKLYPSHRSQFLSLDFLTLDEQERPKDFALAYAITVHKSQGLEWDDVFFVNDANDWLRTRNLCYVAYTRSKKNTYILSSNESKNTGNKIIYKNIFRKE